MSIRNYETRNYETRWPITPGGCNMPVLPPLSSAELFAI